MFPEPAEKALVHLRSGLVFQEKKNWSTHGEMKSYATLSELSHWVALKR